MNRGFANLVPSAGVTFPIAGADVTPDFGAQDITTTGNWLSGATPRASSGLWRGGAAFSWRLRNNTDSKNLSMVEVDHVNERLYLGTDAGFGTGRWDYVYVGPVTAFNIVVGGQSLVTVTVAGVQLGRAGAADFGGGVDVMGVDNAATDPTTAPTNGTVRFASGGSDKVMGGAGTLTTTAPA